MNNNTWTMVLLVLLVLVVVAFMVRVLFSCRQRINQLEHDVGKCVTHPELSAYASRLVSGDTSLEKTDGTVVGESKSSRSQQQQHQQSEEAQEEEQEEQEEQEDEQEQYEDEDE